MSMLWVFYISLTVIGATIYNIAVKVSGDQINVFVFSVFLTMAALAGHIILLLIYKYGCFTDGKSLQISTVGITMAVFAGLSVTLIDVGYFLAVKEGGMISSQLVWTVGGTLLVALIGFLYFKEILSIQKLAGIAFGLASVWLVIGQK